MTAEIVPMLVQIVTGIAGSAATGGLRAFFHQEDVIKRAIQATCSRFPEVEGVEVALHKWTSSTAFTDFCERVSAGERDFGDEDDQIVASFIKEGDFYLPTAEEGSALAREIIAAFISELSHVLYRSDEGLPMLANRLEVQNSDIMSGFADVKTLLDTAHRVQIDLARRGPTMASPESLRLQIQQLLPDVMGTTDRVWTIGQPGHLDMTPPRPKNFTDRRETTDAVLKALGNAAWVSVLGSSGMGKTQLAAQVLIVSDHRAKVWISFRTAKGPARLHLIEQLILNVAELSTQPSSSAELPELITALRDLSKDSVLIILDDLPEVSRNESEWIGELAGIVGTGVTVLSTSQYSLPSAVPSILGTAVSEFPIPKMSTPEVQGMLRSAGAPAGLNIEASATILTRITKGHPWLLDATVIWLRDRGWATDDTTLDLLLSGVPISDVKQEARRSARQLLKDRTTLELLDRLSLLGHRFELGIVSAIARPDPPLPKAEQRFQELLGPYVQRLDPNEPAEFEVSALLDGTGRDYLAPDLPRQIHLAAATTYGEGGSISLTDGFYLLLHLQAAPEWILLARAYVGLLMAIEEEGQALNVEWATHFFPLSMPFPDEIPLSSRIVIRAMQIKLLLLLQADYSATEADLTSLLAGAGDDNRSVSAVISAKFEMLRIPGPAAVVASRAVDFFRTIKSAKRALPWFDEPTEVLFWMASFGIRGAEDVRAVIRIMKDLTDEELVAVLENPPEMTMVQLLVEAAYTTEAEKAPLERDWTKVISVLDEAMALGKERNQPTLRILATRSRAIVRGDYLDDVQGALEELRLAETSGIADNVFVLEWTAGRVLAAHDEPSSATAHFENAIAAGSGLKGNTNQLFDALSHGAIAASRTGDGIRAVRWAGHGVRLGFSEQFYDPLLPLELLGELALIHWKAGRLKKACASLYGAAVQLTRLSSELARRDEVLWKVGHITGWMASVALTGSPPQQASDGEEYIEPQLGFVIRQVDELSELPATGGISGLFFQVGLFATGAKAYGLARGAFDRASELASSEGRQVLAAQVDSRNGPLQVRVNEFQASLSACLRSAKAVDVLQADPEALFRTPSDLDGEWRALGKDSPAFEESSIFRQFYVPAMMFILSRARDEEKDRRYFEGVMEAIRTVPHVARREYWQNLVSNVAEAVQGIAGRDKFVGLTGLNSNDTYLKISAYVALACTIDSQLEEVAAAQAVVLTSLVDHQMVDSAAGEDLTSWIVGHWREVLRNKAFSLSAPSFLRDEEQVFQEPLSTQQAARVLLAAGLASRAPFPDWLHQRLRALLPNAQASRLSL